MLVGQPNADPVNPTELEALSFAIREAVNEMEERGKRKCSLAVKGLEVLSGIESW